MNRANGGDRGEFVDRPDVLVVLTDQQRWDTLGAHGCPEDCTPNLDALADRGTLAERAFTPSPSAGRPARASRPAGTPRRPASGGTTNR